MPPHPKWADDQLEEMLDRMRKGETLTEIAADVRMPSIDTMNRWEDEQDTELGAAITRAREVGFTSRAEKALLEAKAAEDAGLGRLSFDAERWFLGKMYPKKFGEASLLKHANADGSNIDMSDRVNAARERAMRGD